MKLQVYRFRCSHCGANFDAPKTIAGSYGEFILQSSCTGEIAYLNALEDSTYDEVDRILKRNQRVSDKKTYVVADTLRQIYGEIACDPDGMGGAFRIGAHPKCPECGARQMAGWEEVIPPAFVDVKVQLVKHSNWCSLSIEEKEIKVDEALEKLGL